MRVRDQALLIAHGTLAVVLEVGLHALRESEVLVALGSDGSKLVDLRSLGLRLGLLDAALGLLRCELLGHDFAASSSSMTSKSASSTTSSSPPPPLPDG